MNPARYRLDEFTLDTGRHALLRGSETIAVSKLSFRLLCALVEAAPNVVTHDELISKVWGPRRIVTPENLAKRIMLLRRALGDRAEAPRYVAGIRGVGYRLVPEARAQPAEGPPERRPLRPITLRHFVPALTVAALGMAVFGSPWLGESSRGVGQSDTSAIPTRVEHSEPAEGGNVRINVELVGAQTERLIWADSYEGTLSFEDMRGIRREIARSIARRLDNPPVTADIAAAAEARSNPIRDALCAPLRFACLL